MVFNELGDDPESVFASFDKRAFAAASLGQVHRARLKSGEEVAVKVQYPGIARSIAEDFRNLALFMLPGRLGADRENTREQFDDIRTRIERETDYRREAATMEAMRSLFRDDDGIVIPRVFPRYSTQRVLTMQRLEGVHLDQFLATDPPQELRNEFGRKILRSWYRMLGPDRVRGLQPRQLHFHGGRPAGSDRLRLDGRAGRAALGAFPQDGVRSPPATPKAAARS